MKAILIHGAYGTPEENWFPWIKKELEKIGYETIVPTFPTPKNQNLKNWEKIFSKYITQIDKNTIFIGHSLGPAFILTILEKLNLPIQATFLVAGFVESLNNPNFDEINKTFINKKFDWIKIKKNCKKFFIYASDNDPYVPIKKTQYMAKQLNTKLQEIKNAGHFNKTAKYTQFNKLLKDIKTITKST